MTTALLPPLRHAISPYAGRLARERRIVLADIAGSGPGGRIVATDVAAFVPKPPTASPTAAGPQTSALATTIDLSTMQLLLSSFAKTETVFTLGDVALRAAGCALDDVSAAATLPETLVALETKFGDRRAQVVFADIRKASLAPLRQRRLDALAAAVDEAERPAALSLRILDGTDIRPVMMPLIPGRAMGLVLIAGEQSADCLLTFDAAAVDEAAATDILSRFKAYLEVPIRLLA